MKIWKLVLAIIILLLVILLLLPKIRHLVFLSPQGTINQNSLTGAYDQNAKYAIYNNQLVNLPKYAQQNLTDNPVLGESNANKRIEIDLTNQRLYAYEDDKKIYDFPISSGKWGKTPTGRFLIWTKLRYTLMTGGSQLLGTYYYLPNVPYTMFFYNDETPKWKGFSIYGTYWHNNFGHPMSHGCINMKTEEVELIYYWAHPELKGKQSIYASSDNPGTEIIIYGNAPDS